MGAALPMKAPTPARWAESFHPEPPSAARLAHALAAIPAARRAMFHQQLQRMVISRLEGMQPRLTLADSLGNPA